MKKRSFYMMALVLILVLTMSIMLMACDNSKKDKDDEDEEEEVVDIWEGVNKKDPKAIEHFMGVLAKAKSFTFKNDNNQVNMLIKYSKDVLYQELSMGSDKHITQYQVENGVVHAYSKDGKDWIDVTTGTEGDTLVPMAMQFVDALQQELRYDEAVYNSETKAFDIVNIHGSNLELKLTATGIELTIDGDIKITISDVNNTKVSKIKSSSGEDHKEPAPDTPGEVVPAPSDEIDRIIEKYEIIQNKDNCRTTSISVVSMPQQNATITTTMTTVSDGRLFYNYMEQTGMGMTNTIEQYGVMDAANDLIKICTRENNGSWQYQEMQYTKKDIQDQLTEMGMPNYQDRKTYYMDKSSKVVFVNAELKPLPDLVMPLRMEYREVLDTSMKLFAQGTVTYQGMDMNARYDITYDKIGMVKDGDIVIPAEIKQYF